MGRVEAQTEIRATLAEVWDLYFDRSRWASWVDGFGSAETLLDGYPEPGGRLVWRSTPAGRGTVSERVVEHRPRTLHKVAYEDPGSTGELTTRFEILPAQGEEARVRVAQELEYELESGGLFKPVVDRLFVRSQMGRSVQRSLDELRLEAEADARAADRSASAAADLGDGGESAPDVSR